MYGTCNTAANVAAKVVTCPAFTSLYEGATIRVKFTYGNSVNYEDGSTEVYATMNVNNTGAKSINLYGAAHVSSGLSGSWNPGSIVTFTYNGTAWIVNDYHNDRTVYATGSGLTTSYELTDAGVETRTFKHSNSVTAQTTQAVYPIKIDAQGHISSYGSAVTPITSHQTIKQDGVTGATVNRFGTCSTVGGTAQKDVSITSGTFNLETGARLTVKFANANNASNPTLKVGSTAAKNIFHGGQQITTGDNKGLLKGVCDFVYDGTQYHLIGGQSDNSSGGGVMIVNITGSNGNYSADKTYSEISTAISGKKGVFACYNNRLYSLYSYNNQNVFFISTIAQPNYANVVSHYISISSNNYINVYNSSYSAITTDAIIDIYRESSNDPYTIYYYNYNIGFSNFMTCDDKLNLTIRLININDSNGYYMNDSECFYFAGVSYDANYTYGYHGDTTYSETGGYIFTFKNSDGTKTVTMKVGSLYADLDEYFPYADITVTNDGSFSVQKVTVTIASNANYALINAPTVSGQRFVCWIGAATSGWIGSVYILDMSLPATSVWKVSGAGQIDCFALYQKIL